jgi:hypothetical protein
MVDCPMLVTKGNIDPGQMTDAQGPRTILRQIHMEPFPSTNLHYLVGDRREELEQMQAIKHIIKIGQANHIDQCLAPLVTHGFDTEYEYGWAYRAVF